MWVGDAPNSEHVTVGCCLVGQARVMKVDMWVLVACGDWPTSKVACSELVLVMHSHITEACYCAKGESMGK